MIFYKKKMYKRDFLLALIANALEFHGEPLNAKELNRFYPEFNTYFWGKAIQSLKDSHHIVFNGYIQRISYEILSSYENGIIDGIVIGMNLKVKTNEVKK
jgi:hypothetical protein